MGSCGETCDVGQVPGKFPLNPFTKATEEVKMTKSAVIINQVTALEQAIDKLDALAASVDSIEDAEAEHPPTATEPLGNTLTALPVLIEEQTQRVGALVERLDKALF